MHAQLIIAGIALLIGNTALAAPERDPLKPRVPEKEIAEVKTWTSPLYKNAKQAPDKIIADGKALYEGKGTCFNCHGKSGKGDGPAGVMLDPGPRNLTNCLFQNARSDGELLWVIKNGVPGTGMIPLMPAAVTEEEAWKIIAYVRSFCKKT